MFRAWNQNREREYNERPSVNRVLQVNPFHIDKDHSGQSAKFLNELVNAMKGADYFCEDQIEIDYFHRSHFTDINVGGGWKNPYQLAA